MRVYGICARNPNGVPEDPARCIEEVFPTSGQFVTFQCRRSRGHGEDGLYCYQHAKGSQAIKPIMNEKVFK